MSEQNESSPVSEERIGQRVTVRTGRDRYRSDVTVGEHAFVVDEPPKLGGLGLGPTPYDLLCAALATCTTITLRMYADRKELPLEAVIAHVERMPRGESGDSEGKVRDGFRVSLELVGDLDARQRSRLLEIAERCPVHRTLVGGAVIETAAV